jgi:hypothetical protein
VSVQESVILLELARIVREIAVHVMALEARSPSWDSLSPDVVRQLDALERRIAATHAGDRGPFAELLSRVEALEARTRPSGLDASNAQRKARGQSLREAIADILKTAPEATAPLVLECLRSTHAGRPPSARTIRWHRAALRGNGNSNARLPPPGEACSDL